MATVNEKMTAIADPIRTFMKESDKLTLDDMADRANQILVANESLEKVLYGTDFGGKSWCEKFWDIYLNYGTRSNCSYLFAGSGWSDDLLDTITYKLGSWKANYNMLFYYSMSISRTPILNMTNMTQIQNIFYQCTNLKDVNLEGEIKADISFKHSSLLTPKSLSNIISALEDLTDTGLTRTLTLNDDSKAKLTEADIAIIVEQKGWTLA